MNLILKATKFSALKHQSQKRKDRWKEARLDAMEYYQGRTLPYTMDFFDSGLFEKVPAANINVTKRINKIRNVTVHQTFVSHSF